MVIGPITVRGYAKVKFRSWIVTNAVLEADKTGPIFDRGRGSGMICAGHNTSSIAHGRINHSQGQY